MATYGDSTIGGHARVINGNNINHHTYNYTIQQRHEDDALQQAQTNEALLRAAADGETNRVQYLVQERFADRDYRDSDGLTALHHASLSGFEDTVKLLLDLNVHVNAISPKYGTALCVAVIKSRANVIDILLEHGARADRAGGYLGSPVHAACHQDDASILKTLLEHGAPPDQFAIIQADICNQLHYQGVLRKPGKPRYFETQPLHTAARNGKPEMVEMLISRGALATTTYRGWTDEDRIGSTYELAPPDEYKWTGFTSLSGASLNGNVDLIKLLLTEAAKPQGKTASEQKGAASWQGNGAWSKNFSKVASFINAQDSRGRTALMQAAIEAKWKAIEALVEAGADTRLRNQGGCTAVHIAAANGQSTSIRRLSKCGADLELVDYEGLTPISLAARAGKSDCVRVLLELGVALVATSKAGFGVLHEAAKARNGSENVIKLLVAAGCDVNERAKDENESTPLICAAETGRVDSIYALLNAGADPNLKNKKGLYPHQVADEKGLKWSRDTLLKAFEKANENDHTRTKRTPSPARKSKKSSQGTSGSKLQPDKTNESTLPVRKKSPACNRTKSNQADGALQPSTENEATLPVRKKSPVGDKLMPKQADGANSLVRPLAPSTDSSSSGRKKLRSPSPTRKPYRTKEIKPAWMREQGKDSSAS